MPLDVTGYVAANAGSDGKHAKHRGVGSLTTVMQHAKSPIKQPAGSLLVVICAWCTCSKLKAAQPPRSSPPPPPAPLPGAPSLPVLAPFILPLLHLRHICTAGQSLALLFQSISLAVKQISSKVARAGLEGLYGTAEQQGGGSGDTQKKLDVVAVRSPSSRGLMQQ